MSQLKCLSSGNQGIPVRWDVFLTSAVWFNIVMICRGSMLGGGALNQALAGYLVVCIMNASSLHRCFTPLIKAAAAARLATSDEW